MPTTSASHDAATLDPATPVLVGAGSVTRRGDDPTEGVEPLELMDRAARAAAADAGSPTLLGQADLVLVPKGIWDYPDPGRQLAQRWGARARQVLAEVGILQQTIIGRACTDVATGQAGVAVVVGGEARHRAATAGRAGLTLTDSIEPGTPDELLDPAGEIITAVEIERDLAVPAHQYALIESALRHRRGDDATQQRARLGRLWASFAAVAAHEPDAWDRSAPAAAAIATPSATNRPIASPYTKRLCSQWNVDQAAALIITTAGRATELGVPRDRWVFPLASAESQAMIPVPARLDVDRSPATRAAGQAALAHAGLDLDRVAHLDLYSCFPAAVQVQALELGLDLDAELDHLGPGAPLTITSGRPLTVTGGMTFFGGPLNSYVLHSTAAMARVLRDDPGSTGMVTSVSGMLTKPGVALWSASPPGVAFAELDVTDEARLATATRPVDADATGPGRVVAHTVVHERGVPARSVALVEMDDGRRTVAVDADAGRAADRVGLDLVGTGLDVPTPGTWG